MGIPEDKIFTGYDAVDNQYFAQQAEEVRSQKSEARDRYDLPEHYFLSLGRFVPKKNLTTLIRAYRKFLDAGSSGKTHLVMVGSGEDDLTLRRLCAELDLPIYDHTPQTAQFHASPTRACIFTDSGRLMRIRCSMASRTRLFCPA